MRISTLLVKCSDDNDGNEPGPVKRLDMTEGELFDKLATEYKSVKTVSEKKLLRELLHNEAV